MNNKYKVIKMPYNLITELAQLIFTYLFMLCLMNDI